MNSNSKESVLGMKFGRLTVIAEPPHKPRERKVLCRCECGNEKLLWLTSLRTGKSTSCGCFRREQLSTMGGESGTPEYQAWRGLIARCTNPKSCNYERYGARGIRVCPEWVASFAVFLAHVGRRPSPTHSLDRKNNEGHYEPGNVRWATDKEQAENRRDTKLITLNGLTLTIKDWSRKLNIPYSTLRKRLVLLGWPAERALAA